MTTYKPNRSDDWNDYEDLDFDKDSTDYSEIDHSAMEALMVHLGNDHYFEGYAE